VQPEAGSNLNNANSQTLEMLSKNVDIDKKEKVKKLREEHEKPYYSIKKPIDALKEYLENRKNTSVVKAAKTNTVMSSNCNPIYVEHWVLEKYLPVSGKTIGIHPKGSRENGTIK
jgi:hypothetical protein